MTTPVLRCLKTQKKDIELHFLTKERFSSLLEANPYIDKLHCIKTGVKEVIPELKKENFDYIIDLHRNIRSLSVKWKLRKPYFNVNKLNFRKWLLVNFKINTLPDIHIVDRYIKTLEYFGVKKDNKGLDYFIPTHEEVDINTLPQSHRNGYIGIVIGAKHYTKQMPPEKLIPLCSNLNKPVVLLGDKGDFDKAEAIRKAAGEKIYNACGLYSINQSASLVRQAEKIITHDTGLMHVAAAFGKEVVSVWGSTVPAFGMYPYFPEGEEKKSRIVELNILSCRPCSKLGFKKCPRGHFNCMNLIDEDEIVKLLN